MRNPLGQCNVCFLKKWRKGHIFWSITTTQQVSSLVFNLRGCFIRWTKLQKLKMASWRLKEYSLKGRNNSAYRIEKSFPYLSAQKQKYYFFNVLGAIKSKTPWPENPWKRAWLSSISAKQECWTPKPTTLLLKKCLLF